METKRLIIDTIKETDKEDYFHNISHDKKVLETFICRYAETPDDLDFAPYVASKQMFAIRLKSTGRLIGIILHFDEKDGACEVGYGIGTDYWNNGYVTEALERFLEYCFREKGFHKVYASFFTGNYASRRVMEKCGMTFDHFSEKELTYLGVERDLTYYSIEKRNGAYTMNEKNIWIAYCGLNCAECDAHIATLNNDDNLRKAVAENWSKLNGVEITPEMINCDGCRRDGVKTPYCASLCPIRQCALKKNIETCGGCADMENCEKVGEILRNSEEARKNLKG